MISIQSLTDNLLPSVYLKNVTLNSNFKDIEGPTAYVSPYGILKNGESGVIETPTQTIDDFGTSNILISMKLVKTPGVQSEILQLLNSEFKEFVSVYVHQITDETKYYKLLSNPSSLSGKQDLINITSSDTKKTIKITLDDFLMYSGTHSEGQKQLDIFKNEQLLSDGKTTIGEFTTWLDFDFNKKSDFLAYIIVAAIKPSGEGFDDFGGEIFIGKVSSDIVILNGNFQNEGLAFTIAPYSTNDPELSKYGKPGDIWAGDVHMSNAGDPLPFMAGAAHVDTSHPFLNHHIVPVTKFVDNRVKEKIEKNILNVTKTYEKISSLTTKYTNNSLNLLDFQQYKNLSFISDMHLFQDSKFSVNGFFSIDKTTLLESKSALPFLFSNIKQLHSETSSVEYAKILTSIMNSAKLLKLNIYENEILKGTITGDDTPTGEKVPSTSGNTMVFPKMPKPNFSITKETIKLNNYMGGLEHISFKTLSKDGKSPSTLTYRVEVEYKDPTVEFVKGILPPIAAALEAINTVLTRAQLIKSQKGKILGAGFNPYTQKLNEVAINKLSDEGFVDAKTGLIHNIVSLTENGPFKVYIYNPDINYKDILNYIKGLSNVKTATLDHFLTLKDFLINLRANVEGHLASFGSKPTKNLGGTAEQNAYGAKLGTTPGEQSLSTRVIKETKSANITVVDHGYDFIARISGPETFSAQEHAHGKPVEIATVTGKEYEFAIGKSLSQITAGKWAELDKSKSFKATGLPIENLSKDGYSFLNIPVENPDPKSLKMSVILPKTVLNFKGKDVKEDDIFNAIIKFKNMLFGDNTDTSAFDQHENRISNQLNYILNNKFGTSLGRSLISSTTAIGNVEVPPLFNDPDPLGVGAASQPPQTMQQYSAPNKFNYNFIKTALLSKSLLSGEGSFIPNMSKPGFKPLSDQEYDTFEQYGKLPTLSAPAQVKALSIEDDQIGPFKDFLGSDQLYIKEGVINPLYLCYYWFIHQNIVKVEYLYKYKTSSNVVTTKNTDNPYQQGKQINVTQRNVNNPEWRKMSLGIATSLKSGERILCRLVRYDNKKYINKVLLDALNLPLMNNYFILRG